MLYINLKLFLKTFCKPNSRVLYIAEFVSTFNKNIVCGLNHSDSQPFIYGLHFIGIGLNDKMRNTPKTEHVYGSHTETCTLKMITSPILYFTP